MINATKQIFNFHNLRTNAHISSVNYFAGLIGYQFPKHDEDKLFEPLLTSYSIINWLAYYHDVIIPTNTLSIIKYAKYEHHHIASHHPESYAHISDMPDIDIIEMVCDWFAANYEQNLIRYELEFISVTSFYDLSALSKYNFTNHQQELILQTIASIEAKIVIDDYIKIWEPVVKFLKSE